MHRKRLLIVLFITFLLISLGCSPAQQPGGTPGTSGSQPTPIIELPPNLPAPAPTNSAQALENVAEAIYDALAAGQNLNPYIDGVLTTFGVPPLGDADLALVEERFEKGLPLIFAPQVAEMADAYNDGGYVSLDSFIAAANDQGATQQDTGEPLTREYLTERFAEYAGKAQYERGEVLPAFVLALAKERAARFPTENPDPVWGDGLLDPLQLTLLLYSVSYSGAGPLSAEAPPTQNVKIEFSVGSLQGSNPILDWIKEQIQDEVTGEVQDAVEVPLDQVDAAQSSVCASLLLYGHKLKVTNTPKLIYHNDGEKPWWTRVDVTLTFQDDYWGNYLQIDRWVLENLARCNLPRKGPVEGKPLEWSVSSGLKDHGNFDVTASKTDVNGEAIANWEAVPEVTPKSQRTFHTQRDAVGAIIVRAGSLVPGWSGLERIVGLLKDTGNTGDAPLTVIYYVPGGYKVTGTEGQQNVTYSGVICDLEKPFTLDATTEWWKLTFQLTPFSAEAGTFTVSGPQYDVGTLAGEGSYTISATSETESQLTLNFTNLTLSTSLDVHTITPPPYHVTLVPLDTRECDNK